MKRIISFILVLCLLLSVCGCKREDPEDTAAPLDITEGAPEKEELPEPEKEQTQTDEQAKGDKAEPCNLTLENTFSQYEVIVTLTNEETAKKKEYTAKDFADYDVFYVIENDAYYGNPSFKDSYPEYQGRTTLFMYLNEPSKENVLKTVKKLEADERVFAACPNPIRAKNSIIAYVKEEYNTKDIATLKKTFAQETFSDLKNLNTILYSYDYIEFKFDGYINFHDEADPKDAIVALQELLKDERFESVELKYLSKHMVNTISITIKDSKIHSMKIINDDYYDDKITDIPGLEIIGTAFELWGHEVVQDFPREIAEEDKFNVDITIRFKRPTFQAIADAVEYLRKDSRVISANVNVKVNSY
ncbi:MAG: hypothetical protein IJ408_02610 [Clostridia bacterium]|nr:hypothetical protein [Clostridia bacterium]